MYLPPKTPKASRTSHSDRRTSKRAKQGNPGAPIDRYERMYIPYPRVPAPIPILPNHPIPAKTDTKELENAATPNLPTATLAKSPSSNHEASGGARLPTVPNKDAQGRLFRFRIGCLAGDRSPRPKSDYNAPVNTRSDPLAYTTQNAYASQPVDSSVRFRQSRISDDPVMADETNSKVIS